MKHLFVWVALLGVFGSFSRAGRAATEGGWSPQVVAPSKEFKSLHRAEAKSILGTPYAPGSHNVAVDLGQIFLLGELSNRYADSLGLRFHYNYGVSDLMSFDSFLGYSEHSDSKLNLTYLATGLRMHLSWYDKLIPYVNFGLGFYRPSHLDPTARSVVTKGSAPPELTLSSVLFGLHLGAGLDLEVSSRFFFGTVLTFHKMFNVEKQLANGTPLSMGGAFASFLLRGGLAF